MCMLNKSEESKMKRSYKVRLKLALYKLIDALKLFKTVTRDDIEALNTNTVTFYVFYWGECKAFEETYNIEDITYDGDEVSLNNHGDIAFFSKLQSILFALYYKYY